MRDPAASILAAVLGLLAASSPLSAVEPETSSPSSQATHVSEVSGAEIYRQACATCHGPDGTGAPRSVIGFDVPLPNGHNLPDFTDCSTNTVEPLADWMAVVHRGGPVRALDRHMPAFGDALTDAEIERAVRHLWTFCRDAAWPRGDLNFPRALFTEKAFPENETVWSTGFTAASVGSVTNELIYEHRIGARGQYEVKLPLLAQQGQPDGTWNHGIGDIEIAVRRTFYANTAAGRIMAAGAAVVMPTGDDDNGLGSGFWTYEPFAMWGQSLGANAFLQVHSGVEIPSNQRLGRPEAFARAVLGYTLSQNHGFGRAWSPMLEVLVAAPDGAKAEWDVVPQLQVSLSRLQHVLLNAGVRVPLNERGERKPEVVTYILWDWFDGGLFDFWK